MNEISAIKDQAAHDAAAKAADYEHGWSADIETDFAPKGLNEDTVRFISAKKNEPKWMLDWRLKAFRHWQTMPMPDWAKLNIAPIDYQDAFYYAAPRAKPKLGSLDEVDPEILRIYEKLGIPLEEQKVLAGVEGARKVAVDAVFDSVSVATTFRAELEKAGVIFRSIRGLVASGDIDNKPMYTPAWNAALNNGTQAGWISAIWAPSVLVGNAASTAGKWKMAPLPQWDPAKPATGNWGGSSTAVTSQSKHAAEAAKFATWMNTDPTATKALAQVMGVYPASTSAQKTALTSPPAFFSNQADFYAVAAKVAATAAPFTYGPNVNVAFSAYNDQFGKAAEAKSQQGFLDALTSMQNTTVTDMKNTGFTVK